MSSWASLDPKLKDKITAIFDEGMRNLKAFPGELLHDFKHRLGRD